MKNKMDAMLEDAGHLLAIVSKAIETGNVDLVFGSHSKVEKLFARLGRKHEWDAIMLTIAAGYRWEAMRKLVGSTYVATPQRLRPDLQAALMHKAHMDMTASAA